MSTRQGRPLYSQTYRQVGDLVRLNKLNEAIALLTQLEEAYPENASAYQKHAYILVKMKKQYVDAVRVIELASKNCIIDTEVELLFRRLYAEALSYIVGEEKRAEAQYQYLVKTANSLNDSKTKVKLLSSYADFCVRQHKFKEAQDIYISIKKERTNDRRVVVDLARSFRMDSEFEKCLETLAEDCCKEDPFALLEKAHCYIEMGKIPLAKDALSCTKQMLDTAKLGKREKDIVNKKITQFERIADVSSGNWRDTIRWAITQPLSGYMLAIWQGIRDKIINENSQFEALQYFVRVLSENKESCTIPYMMSLLINRGGAISSDQSNKLAQETINNAPDNFSAWIFFGKYSTSLEEERNKYWDKCCSALHDERGRVDKCILDWFVFSYAQYLRKNEKYEDALSIIEDARASLGVNNWELLFEKAMNLSKLGNFTEAYEVLDFLKKRRPEDPAVLDQLGLCLRGMGRLELAYEVYSKKCEIQPDIHGRVGLAKTLFDMGRHDDALKMLLKILDENPNDVETKFLVAEIYKEKGDLDSAEKYLSGIASSEVLERGLSVYYLERKLNELRREKIEQIAELEDAKKLSYLGTMATATAHELNQPVGIIRSSVNAAISDIRDGLFETDEIQPLLELIWNQAERLSKIIDNFRSFARGDRVHREKVDLNDLVKRTISTFEEQFRHRNIDLHIRYKNSQPAPIVWGNPFQLEEVIINLVSNARDALEKDKKPIVWISVFRRKGGASGFIVEDNGPGLSDEYHKKMFVPFVSTKSTEKGTGLGLYISRRIVDNLGGRLKYKGRVGGGASFTVELPPIKG